MRSVSSAWISWRQREEIEKTKAVGPLKEEKAGLRGALEAGHAEDIGMVQAAEFLDFPLDLAKRRGVAGPIGLKDQKAELRAVAQIFRLKTPATVGLAQIPQELVAGGYDGARVEAFVLEQGARSGAPGLGNEDDLGRGIPGVRGLGGGKQIDAVLKVPAKIQAVWGR